MQLKIMNEKRMEKTLPSFLDSLEQLYHSPFRALANTLSSWLQLVIAMWRFTRNNRSAEGFHNNMEMISRRAYGFRNFENYRKRMITHCAMPITGWDVAINRVRWVLLPCLWGRAPTLGRHARVAIYRTSDTKKPTQRSVSVSTSTRRDGTSGRTWTATLSLATDFESVMSTNSITLA